MIVSPMKDKKAKGDSEIDFGTIYSAYNIPRVNLNYSFTKWFVNFQIKFEYTLTNNNIQTNRYFYM